MGISNSVTGSEQKQLLIADVSRAYMHAQCPVGMHVRLCEEDVDSEEERSMCGKVETAMYGTRPAALAWQAEFTEKLQAAGFKPGKASPCIFFTQKIIVGCLSMEVILWHLRTLQVSDGLRASWKDTTRLRRRSLEKVP